MKNNKVIKDYNNLAKSKKFKWIGESLPKNIMTKTQWQCSKDHIWNSTYNNIIKRGCPHCAGNAKLTIRDKLKDKLCKENNIKLIRIPYYIENKEEFIKNEL